MRKTYPQEASPSRIMQANGVSSWSAPVVYEDADLFVVDKPAGLVVHPSPGHDHDTLLDALYAYTPTIPPADSTDRLRLVHRLDKETSGLLVLARTLQAHRYLAYQWRRQTVVKRYLALVQGHPEPAGTIELSLARDPANHKRVVVTEAGQAARTHYATLAQYGGHSLLDVRLETGRTHQIRVHLAAIGHPIAGDSWYGAGATVPGLGRQFLHAHRLTIRLPSIRELHEFQSPLPPDLATALAALQETPIGL